MYSRKYKGCFKIDIHTGNKKGISLSLEVMGYFDSNIRKVE